MELMGNLFIQNPAGLFLVSGLFFGVYFLVRRLSANGRPQGLLWAALAWAAWAVWEFLIMRVSPEANIRVDLMLIIPVVLGLSLAAVVLLFVKRRGVPG